MVIRFSQRSTMWGHVTAAGHGLYQSMLAYPTPLGKGWFRDFLLWVKVLEKIVVKQNTYYSIHKIDHICTIRLQLIVKMSEYHFCFFPAKCVVSTNNVLSVTELFEGMGDYGSAGWAHETRQRKGRPVRPVSWTLITFEKALKENSA